MQFKQLALVAPFILSLAFASPIGDTKRSAGTESGDVAAREPEKDSDDIWLWKKRDELEKDSDDIWLWKEKRDQLEKDSDDIWLW